MRELVKFIDNFIHDEQGLTAVEYALAGALVVSSLASGFIALGSGASNNISELTSLIVTSDPAENGNNDNNCNNNDNDNDNDNGNGNNGKNGNSCI